MNTDVRKFPHLYWGKKHKWEHYKKEWLVDAFLLDEIGITFFAHCFR